MPDSTDQPAFSMGEDSATALPAGARQFWLLLGAVAFLVAVCGAARWWAIEIERGRQQEQYALNAMAVTIWLGECERALARSDITTAVANLDQAVARYNAGGAEQHRLRVQHFWELVTNICDARDTHFNKGNAHYHEANTPAAIKEYTEALKIDPTCLAARVNLALALMEQDDFKGAASECETCLELDPNNADAHFALGCARLMAFDQQGALAEYRIATRLTPNNFQAQVRLGCTLMEAGDLDAAIPAFKEAVRIEPGNATANAQLTQALRLQELRPRLPKILSRQEVPRTPLEAADFAILCCLRDKTHQADAVRLFETAFAGDPKLADDLLAAHRYRAACAATLEASRAGASPLPNRANYRWKAFAWLRADLQLRKGQACSTSGNERLDAAAMLRHWLRDPDLAAVRPGLMRIGWSPIERERWDRLWGDVRATLAEAEKPIPK